MSTSAELAVVVPVFKHSTLLVEAIESALAQKCDFETHVIVVNDGCPFKSTNDVALDYAWSFPERVTYLKKVNGGLSSARNYGIRFALRHFAALKAIYLLDADNRLEEFALANAMRALRENPDCHWVYPNIDMFGLPWSGDYGGAYSFLIHSSTNICEAGSLISIDVFRSGVYFDETMRLGFEDWDFFLSAAERGFKGVNLSEFGFRYRKRPESMLADSHRDEGEIRGAMLRKHKKSFLPKSLAETEHHELPRYAILLADRNEVVLTSDPAKASEKISADEFVRRFWAATCSNGAIHCPLLLFATTSETMNFLERMKILHWAFWKLEDSLFHCHVAALGLKDSPVDRVHIHEFEKVESLDIGACVLLIAPSTLLEVIKDPSNWWVDSIISSESQPSIRVIDIQLPMSKPGISHVSYSLAAYDFLALIHLLKSSSFRDAAEYQWGWREIGAPERRHPYQILRKSFKGSPAFPKVHAGSKNIGFLLPLVEFGGVEKVALNMAREFARVGYVPHLIVAEFNQAAFSSEWREVFQTIIFLDDKSQTSWDGRKSYFGTDISPWADGGNHARALGMLYWLDIIVNCHGNAAHSLMSGLRRLGIKTIASLHLSDLTRWGRPVGHTFLSLAYEHSYDLITTCSKRLADWCIGMGLPDDKVIAVQNAPSFSIDAADVRAAFADRESRSQRDDLRVLFLGRLDRQKGLGRLLSVMRESNKKNLPLSWRLIGKAVMNDEGSDGLHEVNEIVEPPIHQPCELIHAYTNTDVLVVLSDYEGLPLTILEAMKLGVVVIATDVGAISEVITHKANGFLVSKENAAVECLAVLAELSKNRKLLSKISAEAARTVGSASWEFSCSVLIRKLSAIANK